MIHTALGVGFSVDGVEQRCVHALHEVVRPVVVIAEKRCFVLQPEAESFVTFEIVADGVQ